MCHPTQLLFPYDLSTRNSQNTHTLANMDVIVACCFAEFLVNLGLPDSPRMDNTEIVKCFQINKAPQNQQDVEKWHIKNDSKLIQSLA